MSKFNLLIGLYKDKSDIRLQEIIDTLTLNIANDMIEKIHVFWEDETDLNFAIQLIPCLTNEKIVLIHNGKRLLFADLFDYANTSLIDQNIIVANNDIYFGKLERLIGYDLKGRLLALTRWDVRHSPTPPAFFNVAGSADAWIFRTPINLSPQYNLGFWGCDGRLNLDALQAGLLVSNPSLDILAYHNHLSNVRNYDREVDRVIGGTEVTPSKLIWPKKACGTRNCKLASIKIMNDELKIATLAYEVSSHSNRHRQFINIPTELYGLKFTQVMAFLDSPTYIECFDDGLLYILVERNWRSGVGHYLQEYGAEIISLVPEPETADAKWEVWGLPMVKGQSVTIPRQVILVTDNIDRLP